MIGAELTINGSAPVIGGVTLANSTVYVDKTNVYSDYANGASTTVLTGGTVQATPTRSNADATFANTSDVLWSVAPADNGVTIDENGVITVAATAVAQDYTITAAAKTDYSSGDSKTATLKVEKTNAAVASVAVSGGVTAMSVGESENVASTAFTAEVKDQWGDAMADETVNWTVAPAEQGVTIDADGKLHVAATATVNGTTGKDFTVTATSATNSNISANAASIVHIASLAPWTFTGSYANYSGSVTYGGAAPTLTAAVSDTDATPTFTDYASSNTNVATITSSGAVTIVGAGTTELTVKAAYSADHHAATTGKYTLTVDPKSVTASVSSVDAKTFDGTTTATNGVLTLGTDAIVGTDQVAVSGTFEWTSANAGTTTLNVTNIALTGTAAANYSLAATSLTGVIAPNNAQISKAPNGWTTAPAANQLTYTGEAQALITAGTPSVADSEIKYKLGENATTAPTGEWGTTIPEGTNAGTYYVWSKVDAVTNYDGISAACTTVTIARKTITPVIVLFKTELNYTGSPQTPTVTVYTDSTKSTQLALTTDYTLKWTKGSEEVTSITDVGSYTATVTGVTSGSNYSFTQPVTATFTMKKSAQTAAVALSSIASSLTYGTPVTGVTVSGGSGTGAYSLVLDKTTGATENDYVTITADGTSFTITPKKATPDGTPVTNVTVYGKRAGDNNCDDAYSEGATFTIAKKSVTATIDTVDDKTYNGTAAGSGTLKLDDVKTGDAVTAIGTFTWTAATAGTTTISVSGIALDGADKDNYTLSNSTITAAVAGKSIAPKQVTLTWAPDPQSPYTGNPQTYTGATVVGAENNETLGVTYSETNTVTRTNAGSYTAEVIALSGDTASNYEFASTAAKTQAWTITPKAVTNPTVAFSVEKAYYNNGADVTPTVTVKDGEVTIPDSEYTLTWTGTGVTGNKLTLAGTYTLTVTDAKTGTDTGNYTISDKVASFTVDKTAQTTALNITGAENKTYGDADFTVTVGGGNGTGAYGLTASPADAVQITAPATGGVFTVSILKACETVTLTATKAGDDNFAAATEKTATFTIATKTLTASIATVDSKTYDGTTTGSGTLSLDGVKTGDDVTASGTFTWASADAETTNVSVSGITLAGSAAANYTVAATLAEQEAPNGAKINKAPNDWATAPAAKQLTYTGADQALVTAGTPNVSVATSDYQYALGENATTAPTTGWSSSISAGQDAGTYYVWCKVNETGNYSAIDATCVPVTIAPMPVTISWTADGNAIPASGKLPYKDGVAYTFAPTAKDSAGNPAPNLTLALDAENSTTPTGKTLLTDVATYTVKAKVATGMATNYSFPSNMGATTVEIEKAALTVEWQIDGVAKTESVYSAANQSVTAVVKNPVDGGKTLTASTEYTIAAPTGASYTTSLQPAGAYSFTITLSDALKDNYTLPTNATQTITIAKATRTITATVDSSPIKGVGGTKSITLSVPSESDQDDSAKNATLSVSASPNDVLTLPTTDKFVTTPLTVTGAKEGVTTLTFTLGETANYQAGTATVSVTVDAGWTVTKGTVTGGTVTADKSTAAAGTKVTLTLTPANGYLVPAASAITFTPAGPTASLVEGETDKFEFTMGEANTTYNVTFAKETFGFVTAVENTAGAEADGVTLAVKNSDASAPITEASLGDTVKVVLSGTDASKVSSVYFVKAEPETGETVDKFDLTKVSDGVWSLTMPAYKVRIVAVKATEWSVTYGTLTNGSITAPASDTKYLPGTTVTVTVSPASDYTSGGVTYSYTLNGVSKTENATPTTTNTYEFTVPDADVTLSANFVANAVQDNAETQVTTGGAMVGESDVQEMPADVKALDNDTRSQIKSAAAGVAVAMDDETQGSMTNVATAATANAADKETAVDELSKTGIITVTDNGTGGAAIKDEQGNDAEVRVVTKVFLEVGVTSYEEGASDATLTMDITPKQQKVATIVPASDTTTKLDETNSVPLATPTPVTVAQPVDLTIGVPRAMGLKAGGVGGFIFLTHKDHIYRLRLALAVDGRNFCVRHRNTLGFSEFTLSVQDESVANYEFSDTETRYFTSFKGAVDDALANGKTEVHLRKNPVGAGDTPAAINKAVALTIVKEGDATITYEALKEYFTAASGFNKNFTPDHVNNGVFDFIADYTVEIAGASSVTVGSNTTLTATVKDSTSATYVPSGSDTLVWTSSNTGVATVDSDGKVTGVAAGSATITATFKKNNADPAFEGTKTITVTTSSGGGAAPATNVKAASGVKNGSVKFSTTNAKAGDKVTVTATPNQGYKVASVTVKDSKGNDVAVTENADGTFSFTMPSGAVTVTPVFEKADKSLSRFIDVDENAFYAKAVEWAVSNGITDGVSDTEFAPNDGCTRAQAVTFLYRAAGAPEAAVSASFQDVAADSYYAKAVAWAVANGITNGMSDTEFAPDAICTRAQIVTFLSRYEKAAATSGNKFADVSADAYYAGAVGWAVANGITNGVSETEFAPDAVCTRAHIVTFLYRDFVK